MRIGITTSNYFRFGGSDKGFEDMKRDGWDVCDYSDITQTDTELFELSEAAFERHILADAAAARDAGIGIYQTHGPWRYPPRDATKEDRAERFEKMCRDISATRLLGAKYMVIHPVMPWGCGAPPCAEEYMDVNREFFSRLIPVAEKEGVVIAFENMPMPLLPLGTPEEITDFVREMASPCFRACLDTGHAAVITQDPTKMSLRAAKGVRVMGKEYLTCLHVHDNDGERDLHMYPFTGVTDFMAFADALREIGYEGPLTLECGVDNKPGLPEELKREHLRLLVRTARVIADRADVK